MTLRTYVRRWWLSDPQVVACDQCGCPIQATSGGTTLDGMRAHYKVVHPGTALVEAADRGAGAS